MKHENRCWTQVLRIRKQFLFHWWHPSCTILLMVRHTMHGWGKHVITIMTNGTYLWLFVTQIFHSGHNGDHNTLKILSIFHVPYVLHLLTRYDIVEWSPWPFIVTKYNILKWMSWPIIMMQYRIIFQDSFSPFNRGILSDIGFTLSQLDMSYDCYVIHDIDILPEDDRNYYTCSSNNPVQVSTLVQQFGYK